MLEYNQIDNTVLGTLTDKKDVKRVVDESLEYGMNICIPPSFVNYASKKFSDDVDSELCTVIGFPHGNQIADVKLKQSQAAVEHGATEIDMVAPIYSIKNNDQDTLLRHVKTVTNAVDVPVKVIIESNILDEEHIRFACELCRDAGADYVKTSTGFTQGGAEIEDVRIMSDYLPVKASGGISTLEIANRMLDAGATRIGCSSGKEIAEEIRLSSD